MQVLRTLAERLREENVFRQGKLASDSPLARVEPLKCAGKAQDLRHVNTPRAAGE